MKTAIIIPARYGSTRFPGKPLAKIGDKTMLARVVDLARSIASEFDDISVFVTSDDERIESHAHEIGAEFLMTSPDCPSGSDRCLSAVKQLPETPDFILNLQGDAPFTPPQAIKALLAHFKDHPDAQVVTPVHQLSWNDLTRLRTAKEATPFSGTTVVLDKNNNALWFSKNIIPAIRKEPNMRDESEYSPVFQHMGLYGYRTDILEQFCALPQSHYEQLEGLEQLRLLENGITISCVKIDLEEGQMQSGIDTPEDLARAENLLNQ